MHGFLRRWAIGLAYRPTLSVYHTEEAAMLWYCRYKWHAHTSYEKVAERVVKQHDAGTNQPDKIRGWYDLAGGGAGFLLVETDNADDLTMLLQPYMDLMDVDVHAVSENDYNDTINRLRRLVS
jgi:hypothetical protein